MTNQSDLLIGLHLKSCRSHFYMLQLVHIKYMKEGLMERFLTDDDLLGLLDELEQDEATIQGFEFEDEEMEASNRRFEEIIKKHQMN